MFSLIVVLSLLVVQIGLQLFDHFDLTYVCFKV